MTTWRDELRPWHELAKASEHLVESSLGEFLSDRRRYEIRKFVFTGPDARDMPVRLGLFAVMHGDEREGLPGLLAFARDLTADPEIARGYVVSFYPICNPTGLEDNTRHSRRGRDLNREFWRDSPEPEVRLLEAELAREPFDGIVSLHGDNECRGLYGFVKGAVLSAALLEPALAAASKVIPRCEDPVIDGFAAQNGIISQGYPGILSAPRGAQPFEIVFETAQCEAVEAQVEAARLALHAILREYRGFIAISQNI